MELRDYIIRRLFLLIPVLLGITLLIFACMMLFSPTQRAALYATSPRELNNIEAIIRQYNLNAPVHVQYINWMKSLLSGNLGWSKTAGAPVLAALIDRFPATLELTFVAAPMIILPGIYLGTIAAVNKDKLIDQFSRVLAIGGWSLPTFWLALVFVLLLVRLVPIFPTGRVSTSAHLYIIRPIFETYTGMYTIDGLLNGELWIAINAFWHLILPAVTLSVVSMAALMRVMRSSMLEELRAKYVTTARAKGLDEKTINKKHARRNALISPVTVATWMVAILINGVAVVEIVFSYPGVGNLFITAATQLDIPMVLGFALFNGIVIVGFNLLADILYAYLDPRISY